MKRALCILGCLVVVAGAGLARIGTFWAPHDHPVESAYAALAMKMGTYPSLSGYSTAGTSVRHVAAGATPIILPYEAETSLARSLDNWPSDTNLFKYKPPMLPAFMAYAHHQVLGPKVRAYPLIAPRRDTGLSEEKTLTIFNIQSWALVTPYLSGLIVIALTFVLGWRLSGPGTGLLAAAFTALHPYQALVSVHVWPEATLTAFLLATVLALRSFLNRGSWAGCLIAGMIFALAVLTDAVALYVVPAIYIWTFVASGDSGRPLWKKVCNPYFAAFVAGLFLIGQVWFKYTHGVLGGGVLTGTDFDPRPYAAVFMEFVRTGGGFVLWVPPLIAALWARGQARYMLLIALSLIILRPVLSPQAPWDERAWAAAVPFMALAAATALGGIIKKLQDLKNA